MPLYEFYCRRCAATYELLRPMSESDEPGTCPQGHACGARTVTAFAAIGRAGSGSEPAPSGGCGCGGGGCGCGAR